MNYMYILLLLVQYFWFYHCMFKRGGGGERVQSQIRVWGCSPKKILKYEVLKE